LLIRVIPDVHREPFDFLVRGIDNLDTLEVEHVAIEQPVHIQRITALLIQQTIVALQSGHNRRFVRPKC
jgi:hypothetical protein